MLLIIIQLNIYFYINNYINYIQKFILSFYYLWIYAKIIINITNNKRFDTVIKYSAICNAL